MAVFELYLLKWEVEIMLFDLPSKPSSYRAMAYLRRVSLAFVCLFVFPGITSSLEENRATLELMAKIEAGWARLIESDSIQMSYSIQRRLTRKFSSELKGTPLDREDSLRIAKGLKGVLIEYPRKLVAANSEYQFLLRRKEPKEPWTLADTEQTSGGRDAYQKNYTSEDYSQILYPSSSFFGSSGPKFLEMLKEARLRLLSNRRLPSGTLEVSIRIEYPPSISPEEAKKMEEEIKKLPAEQRDRARSEIKKTQQKSVFEGKMSLDPALDYAVVEGEGRTDHYPDVNYKFKRKAHKGQPDGQIILCDSIVSSVVTKDMLQEETLIFTEFKNSPAPEDVFFLSHYNFPEFLGVTPPSTKKPIWLYILAAAGGFLVLSIVLRQVWRRASTRAAAR